MSKIKEQFQGMSPRRYAGNPLEKAFALAWQEANDEVPGRGHATLAYLMDKHNRGEPNPPLSERDWLVACTVIQWLGSPVGQNFVEHVLYKSAGKWIRENLERATE